MSEPETVAITIDGREITVPRDTTILTAAKELGIHIPTMCFLEATGFYGACRVCLVEITEGDWQWLDASCVFPIRRPISVSTNSENVREARKTVLDLLLARCPDSAEVKALASEYGVEDTSYKVREKPDDCILCGLCVRVCNDVIGVGAISFANRGARRIVGTPFFVDSDVCIGCGACAFVCPTKCIDPATFCPHPIEKIPSEFNAGLDSRGAIYVPFPQAVPNAPTIDRDNCIYFKTGGCQACEKICPADAIDYETLHETVEKKVGAVVVASGLSQAAAEAKGEFGFGRYPNVVTNMQFERLLSASGPCGGEVLRPSDSKVPHRIAWIQCVGSREKEDPCARHCSAFCCMQATKHAVIAKEHHAEVETTIFHNDVRAFGKGFERYFVSARERHGVRYIRGLPSSVREMQSTHNLRLKFWKDEEGLCEEEFDMVVLSAGLRTAEGMTELAQKIGFDMDENGYPAWDLLAPGLTSRPGLFLCGAAAGPVDIPGAVIQGGAAAAEAGALLSPARNTLVASKEYPEERNVEDEPPRAGVFVCRCGANIGGVLDVPEIVEKSKAFPHVVHAQELLYSCSRDGLAQIQQAITEKGVNRVIVASCTPRTHEAIFQEAAREVGLNRFLVEMANIREQSSWVHREVPEEGTRKAEELLAQAVAKAVRDVPLHFEKAPVVQRALVIGGGLAGMIAAENIAEQGIPVELVEREPDLGGIVHRFRGVRGGEATDDLLRTLVERVSSHPLINVYTGARLKSHSGHVGHFACEIVNCQDGELLAEVEHGGTIVATGAKEYQPKELAYGEDDRVLTQLELERALADGEDRCKQARNVVMIQCVGSRNDEHPYCSRVCCLSAVKNALALRKLNPDVNIHILFRDMRTEGMYEEAYLQAREAGVVFDLYDPEDGPNVQTGDQLKVQWTSPETTEKRDGPADLVVLSAGVVPPEGSKELAQLLRVTLNEDNYYLEAHLKLRPVEFASEGIFLCGMAHGPKAIPETIAQARAAAARAAALLVHETRDVGGPISEVEADRCVGCLTCVRVCPYNVPQINDEGVAEIEAAACQGCGICVAECPARAITLNHWRADQIDAQLAALFEDLQEVEV